MGIFTVKINFFSK